MTKLMEIKSCFECNQRIRLKYLKDQRCQKNGLRSLKGIVYSFPDWCPLLDASVNERIPQNRNGFLS